jgi:hypothetical protein
MYDSLSRSSLRNSGHRAALSFLLAGTLGVLVACGSDDPARQTGTGGTGSTGQADAGPPLRGEGLESTPDFDITNRQVPVPPRDQLTDSVAALGQAGSGSTLPPQADAGADAATAGDAALGEPGDAAAAGDSGAP